MFIRILSLWLNTCWGCKTNMFGHIPGELLSHMLTDLTVYRGKKNK